MASRCWASVAHSLRSVSDFQSGPLLDRVFATYKLMHTHQTVDFVSRKVSFLLLMLTLRVGASLPLTHRVTLPCRPLCGT